MLYTYSQEVGKHNCLPNILQYNQWEAGENVMIDSDDKVMPIEPIRTLRVQAIKPFGIEQRFPQRYTIAKKRKPAKPKDYSPDIITPDKVDCKI